jgi:hypothetical protein
VVSAFKEDICQKKQKTPNFGAAVPNYVTYRYKQKTKTKQQ